MTVIITMAGLGSRFRDVGYQCPKYMIEARGKTLFEWSMDSLAGFKEHVSKYVFVVRSEDHASDFIRDRCMACGISNIEIVEIDYMTDGQAATCLLALPHCSAAAPVMIYNIDTYVEPYEMTYERIAGDGYLPCFHAQGTHFSFVKLDRNGRVTEVREKERISDNCTLGAYYFSSAGLYQELYEEYYGEPCDTSKTDIVREGQLAPEKKEQFIAPLYQLMVEKGMRVEISIVDADKVHVLGTPEELEVFINES